MDINWTKRPNQQFYKFKRTDLIAWYVDDCNEEKTIREDYVSYMENYVKVDIYGKCGNMDCKPEKVNIVIHPRLDLVKFIVRPLLFTKLSLFTKSSLEKE